MSRSKVVLYLKDKGLNTTFKEDFYISFKTISSSLSLSNSHVDSEVRDFPCATTVPSFVMTSVALVVGAVSTSTVQPLLLICTLIIIVSLVPHRLVPL